MTVLAFLAAVLFGTSILEDTPRNTFSDDALIYFAFFIAATVPLVAISYMKGPKPKWRWGSKPNDNPDEDI